MPRHLVRLAQYIDADTPSEAVTSFVEQLVAKGLRSWVYRVDAVGDNGIPTEIVGLHDGHGRTVQETSQALEPIGDDATDEELVAYADRLNRDWESS